MTINAADLDLELIDRAIAEDVGAGDVTAEVTVPAGARGVATITQKAPGVISGLAAAEAVFLRLDPGRDDRAPRARGRSGASRPPRCCASRAPRERCSTAKRVALNFLGRLSGVDGDRAVVSAIDATVDRSSLDTRKTTPGLRELEKRAVPAAAARTTVAGPGTSSS